MYPIEGASIAIKDLYPGQFVFLTEKDMPTYLDEEDTSNYPGYLENHPDDLYNGKIGDTRQSPAAKELTSPTKDSGAFDDLEGQGHFDGR